LIMVLYNILNILFGYVLVSVENGRGCEKLFSRLIAENITFWNMENIHTRTVFRIKPYYRETLISIAKELGLSGKEISVMTLGLPFKLMQYKMRLGLLAGILISAVLILYSTMFVWKIDVIGNEKLTYTQVTNMLEKQGFREGTFTPKINLKRIETAVMVENSEIAFISIYLKGTNAIVQVHERSLPWEKENLTSPVNLVAAHPGQVINLEVISGESVVKRGQAVEKGQLLVSGVTDSNTVGFRIKSASGKVMAATTHEINYKIPIEQTEKYYTGRQKTHKSIKILGKYINFFINSGNLYSKYDTIYNEEPITLFGVMEIPVYYVETVFTEYVEKTTEIDRKRAREMAYDEYRKFIATRKCVTIEKETLHEEVSDGYFVLSGYIDCIEDISQKQNFYYIQEQNTENDGKDNNL